VSASVPGLDGLEPLMDGDVPASLARSPVFLRMPAAERARLDREILLPGRQRRSLEALTREFDLPGKYGISAAVLRTYARKLEQVARPVVTSQILAGVLGCLPAAYRRKVVQGSEVILLSKVLNALGKEKNQLSVAELAKLASVLGTLARRPSGSAARSARAGRRNEGSSLAGDIAPVDPVKLAESVRMVYGLSWPPEECKQGPN